MTDTRLIEAGFPCHQVGAETQRERGASNMLPPIYYLHVWWARRPLTPSRAAVAASLLPADTDVEIFIRELGIEKQVVKLGSQSWVMAGKLLERVEQAGGTKRLKVDKVVLRAFEQEQARRVQALQTVRQLKTGDRELANHPVLVRWEQEVQPLRQIHEDEWLTLTAEMADPAHVGERIVFKSNPAVKQVLGAELSWDNEDLYGYARAYQNDHLPIPSGLTVLDPTSGGGSIPFEALRLGHKVIANELNPVATTILYATLDYPARFGVSLVEDIKRYATLLVEKVEPQLQVFYPNHQDEHIADYLYCRQVTCPSCGAKTPLLNTSWLSKEAGDPWGVRIVTDGKGADATYRFETYQAKKGKGPNGEDPEHATVDRGIGQCVHCKQAIDGDEIKAQARGESQHGTWQDELYAVVAVRFQPKLDKHGKPQYDSKGNLKTEKIRFFRPPNPADFAALQQASVALKAQWDHFDQLGLIPTEKFPEGNDMRPVNYGMTHFYQMFNDRQLLGHLHMMEALQTLKPQILAALGAEKGRAVITYLQFGMDKIIDYNSRQTRWITQRGIVSGTFGRHDYSLKWTYGEMVYAGEFSGAQWGQNQAVKAYTELCSLLSPVLDAYHGEPPVKIINGTAAYMGEVSAQSVDLVCMDPPYYDNVQYAELSDFYYVWQKRSLSDLYPETQWPRLTNKREEAVANPTRDGSAKAAKTQYEKLMGEIFAESRRVLKDAGLMTLMFTHKSQDAWETLTKSLIEAGWIITASFPVESEFGYSTHQLNQASAASSIFITCRKRTTISDFPAVWTGLGCTGVQSQIRTAVEQGLHEFAPLKLNPVDQMVACYGRALQVLSEHWPVMDGDEQVSPIRAMNEASRVVASHQIRNMTGGRIHVDDLDTETALALTTYGIWGHNDISYSELMNLSRSLNIALESKSGGYNVDGRMIGYNTEIKGKAKVGQAAEAKGYAAPLVKSGSKLRLAKPEERNPQRIAKPQSDWDVLHGILLKYREGDIPVARAYLDEHRPGNTTLLLDLLHVWGEEAEKPELRNEARAMVFGLRQS